MGWSSGRSSDGSDDDVEDAQDGEDEHDRETNKTFFGPRDMGMGMGYHRRRMRAALTEWAWIQTLEFFRRGVLQYSEDHGNQLGLGGAENRIESI